jgi:hypothetical protein
MLGKAVYWSADDVLRYSDNTQIYQGVDEPMYRDPS